LRTAVADVVLGLGVTLELIAVAGTIVMRDAFERLHFAGPGTLGAIVIMAAVWVQSGPSTIGLKALLVAVFLLVTSPVLVHYTARAIREWREGDWRPTDSEASTDP
jgi:multicomponent Na+:H+ antiporter subunit G